MDLVTNEMFKNMRISKVVRGVFFLFIIGLNNILLAQNWPADTITVDINSGDPAYPFPQFLEYDYGKSLAANNAEGVTHADMEKSMREAYQIMMHRTITTGDVLDGREYMVFNPAVVPKNNNTFVSEGDGYALLAAAYMGDKTTFDGLWMWIHDNRLSQVKKYLDCVDLRQGYRFGNNLPGWKNDETTAEGNGDNDSATDGDYDIAMGLLLALKQWGENSGITDACGDEINYRNEALLMIKSIVDTVAINDGSGGAGAISFISGDIGVDGYCKNGNTWGEVSSWRYNAGLNTVYPWALNAPNTFASPGNVNVYTDYIGPAYFKQFGDFLQTNGGTAWQIDQYRRGEASSDWMMGEMFAKGFIASSGNCSVNDDGTVSTFGNHPSGADGEDFRAAWRTILNYVWHGNPTTTWNPVTHQVDNVPNTYEYDIALKHAANLKEPGVNAGASECSTLGASPDPSCPNFTGPAHIPQLWGQDGSVNSQYRTNYNVGVGGAAAVASEDLELLGDIYRQSEILWDDVSAMSSGLTDDERYIKSTPNYFHGFFRLLGMLTTSGNLHSPDKFEAEANLKIYMSVDKTFAFSGDIVTYTVDYRNYGSVDATGTTISIPIPTEYAFVNASDGGAMNGTNLEWSIGTVPGFQSLTGVNPTKGQVTFTVQVNPLPTATRACLESTISSNNAPDWVSNEFPNNATYTMERNCVDLLAQRNLKINKSTNRSVMNTGDIVSFYVDFENESSGDAWLNGGRSEVVVSYGNYAPGAAYNFYQFYRFWHDAPEAYINMNNYRVSYYMNDAAAVGLYDAGTNPTGWTFSVDNQSDLDKYGYNPAAGQIDFTYQEIPPGSDANGSWNQRLIVQFADVLTAPASHIYDKLDSDYLIHKGVTGPGFIRTALASNPPDALNARILDDWSYDGTLDVGQVAAQNERFTPITNNWADYNNLNIPVTNYSRYVCDPDVDNYDRVLVEEFDGYTWRRLSGRGPLPGREVEFVVIRDTIPLELDWFGFTDDEALGVNAIYTPSGNPAADGFTGIVTWEIPALLVGQSGDFEYQAVAGNITCPGDDIEFENAAWIESSTDSPDSSKVDLTLTCVSQPPVLDPQNSLLKTANKTAVSVGDPITYTLTYENNDGSVVESDFSNASDWQALGAGALPDFGGATISLDQNSNSNAPGTNGYAFGHTKSHGKNGFIESVWDLNNGGLTSFVLRHTAGTPGQADFQGIRVEMEPRPWGANTVNIKVYNNTTEVYSSGPSPIAHGGSASPLNIKVEVIEDELFIYFNNPDGVPLISVDGLTNLDAGYVGLQTGSVTNEIISWETHFDSAFDLEFYDPIVSDLTGVNSISNSGVVNSGTVEWPSIDGPILAGEILTRSFSANVATCNTFLANIGYADVYGVDSLASLYSVSCDGVPPICTQPTGVGITMDPVSGEVCEGGTVELTASATGGIFDYEFRDGDGVVQAASGTTTFTASASEDYTVVVTDPSDPTICTVTSDAVSVLIKPDPLSVIETTDLDYCASESGVALTATEVIGATYSWKDVATDTEQSTTNPSTELTAGDYYVEVSLNGCMSTSTSVTITEIALPLSVIETTELDYCPDLSGVVLTATEVAGATYSWKDVSTDTEQSTTNPTDSLAAGDYYVEVSLNGCMSSSTSVEIIEHPETALPVTDSVFYCLDDVGAIPLEATGSGTLSWFTVETGGVVLGTAPTPSTSPAGDQSYYVSQEENGCESERVPLVVRITDLPIGTIETTELDYCASESGVALTATDVVGATYSWKDATDTEQSTTNPSSELPAGDYYVEVSLNGCVGISSPVTINELALPVATIETTNLSYCANKLGVPLTATIVPGGTYSWKDVATDTEQSTTNPTDSLIAGDYYVEVTVNGCTNTSTSVTIESTALPTVSLGDDTTLCSELLITESLPLTIVGGAGDFTVSYLDPNNANQSVTTSASTMITPLLEGTYSLLEVEDGNGCISIITGESAVIDVHPDLTLTGPITSCDYVTKIATVEGTLEDGLVSDYQLLEPQVPAGTGALNSGDFEASFLADGETAFSYSFDDGTECAANSGEFSGTVNCSCPVEGTLTFALGEDGDLCVGETAEVEVTVGGSVDAVPLYGVTLMNTITNTVVNPTNDNGTVFQFTLSEVGTYIINNVSDDNCSGTGSGTVEIVITNPAEPTVSNVEQCQDDTEAELTATGTGLLWYLDGTTTTNTATAPTPSTATGGVTSYYVTQTVDGCESDRVEIEVTITDKPELPTVSNLSYCLGSTSAPLTATGTGILNWYLTETGVVPEALAPTPATTVVGVTSYYVSQVENGCESDRAELEVEINDGPLAVIETVGLGYCGNTLGVPLTATAVTGATYSWKDVATDTEQSTTNPTDSLPSGAYYVEVSLNGCTSTSSVVTVEASDVPSAEISSGSTVCVEDLATEVLTVTPSGGQAPYDVTYTDAQGLTQTIVIAGALGDISSPLEVGDYTLVSIEDENGCFGTITDKVGTIDVYTELTIIDPLTSCDLGTNEATVGVTLNEGVATGYVVEEPQTPTAGVLTVDEFSASFAAVGNTVYSYTFSDGTGCTANTKVFTGTMNCECNVTAEMGTGATICEGETASIEVEVQGSDEALADYTVTITDQTITYTESVVGIVLGESHTFVFEVPTAGVYTIQSVGDQNCDGSGSGSAEVMVLPATDWLTNVDATPISICEGSELNLQGSATGEGISYQWTRNTTDIALATTNVYNVSSVTQADAGVYQLEVLGTCGDTISAEVEVTILQTTAITQDLLTDTIKLCEGNALNLELMAEGEMLTYTWDLGTSTTNIYDVTSVTLADEGDYSVVVSGTCGDETTSITPVRINAQTVITEHPEGHSLCPGNDVTLEGVATGTDLQYQWYQGIDPIAGETTTSLTLTSVDDISEGDYTLEVTGACGTEITNVATVLVGAPTEISVQPEGVSICASSSASFGVTASGESITYQWFKDNVIITGATASSHTVTGATVADAGNYTVEVTGTCGVLKSDEALLEIAATEFPSVTLSVDKETVCQGDEVVFTAGATAGGDTPQYEFVNIVSGITLQGPTTTNILNLSDVQNDRDIRVILTSNSGCIDGSASNTATAETSMSVIEPATAVISSHNVPEHFTSEEEVEGVTVTNEGTTGNYNEEWEVLSGEGTITASSGLETDVQNLVTFDAETEIQVTVQDENEICPAATATITIIKKEITIPVITGDTLCASTDLPYDVIGNVLTNPSIEEATMIDQEGISYDNTSTLSLTDVSLEGEVIITYEIFNSVADTTLSDTAGFIIYQNPTAAIAGDDQITCGTTAQLEGNTLTTGIGNWTCDNGVTITDATSASTLISNLPESVTTCVWTTSNGNCPETTDMVEITRQGDVTDPVLIVNGEDKTGSEVDVCITDVVTLEGATVKTGETMSWSSIGTSVSTISGDAQNVGALTLDEVGTTVIRNQIESDIVGCDVSFRTVTVNVYGEPIAEVINVSAVDVCEDATDVIIETGTLETGETGSWTSTIQPTETSSNTYAVNPESDLDITTNTLTWEVENIACGVADTTITIEVTKVVTPSINIVPQEVQCEGADVILISEVENAGTGTYTWTYTGLPTINETTGSSSYTINDIETGGEVSVTLTSDVKCANPTTATKSITIVVEPGPSPLLVNGGEASICITEPFTIMATDTTTTVITTYQWYLDGSPLGSESLVLEDLTNVTTAGEYTLVANNQVCEPIASSNSLELDVREEPTVDASANGIDPIEVEEGELALLFGEVSESATIETIWSSESLEDDIDDIEDLETIITTEDNGGEHLVRLTAIDGACEVSDVVLINIRSILEVPNVFTANGDGENDYFEIKGIESYPKARVHIYNRWGNEVFTKLGGYKGNEWDGGTSPEGVYYYVIDYGEGFGKDGTGCVHLMR